MRPGQQNKRMRGRGRRGPSPLTRNYESNGPDVKVRGTAAHVAEKYMQLARDAHASGDPVMAENYLQHAEHYFRIIAAAQQSQQQSGSEAQPQRYNGGGRYDSGPDEGDEGEGQQPAGQQASQPNKASEEQTEAGEGGEDAQAKETEDQGPTEQVAEQPAPAPRRRRRRSPSKGDTATASGDGANGSGASDGDGDGAQEGKGPSDSAEAEDVSA